jgi:hypothetical protein
MASRNSCASHFRFISTVKITVFSEVKPRGLAEAINFSGEFSANPEDRSCAFFQIVTVMPQPKDCLLHGVDEGDKCYLHLQPHGR